MFFGNQYAMRWIACPAINAGIGKEKWHTSGAFLNGGGYSRSSTTGHKVYQFSWPPASAEDTRLFLDFADGVYGPGPFYFADPFAMSTNMMSTVWGAPWLMRSGPNGEGSGSMLEGVNGAQITTPANTKNLPPFGMQYSTATTAVRREFVIPIPPGYSLYLGVIGSGNPLQVSFNGGALESVPMIATGSPPLASVIRLPSVSGELARLGLNRASLAGTSTIYAISARLLPGGSASPTGSWVSGQGNSGVQFEGAPQVTGYSAPGGIDRQGVTASFREVGTWA